MLATDKPLVVTFRELAQALAPLHLWEKAHVDRLHDVWKQGAPSPDSIVRDPRGFDERRRQAGNHVRRVVFSTPLAAWVAEVSAARGFPYTLRQALALVAGATDYGVDQARTEQ